MGFSVIELFLNRMEAFPEAALTPKKAFKGMQRSQNRPLEEKARARIPFPRKFSPDKTVKFI
jgi:hypothetical protein